MSDTFIVDIVGYFYLFSFSFMLALLILLETFLSIFYFFLPATQITHPPLATHLPPLTHHSTPPHFHLSCQPHHQ
jgi:hypothetical protein